LFVQLIAKMRVLVLRGKKDALWNAIRSYIEEKQRRHLEMDRLVVHRPRACLTRFAAAEALGFVQGRRPCLRGAASVARRRPASLAWQGAGGLNLAKDSGTGPSREGETLKGDAQLKPLYDSSKRWSLGSSIGGAAESEENPFEAIFDQNQTKIGVALPSDVAQFLALPGSA
jgi:hypothetical protein